MQNRLLKYYIQTLSPVHVGSGLRLRNGLDFFSANQRTWLVNKHEFEKTLKENPKALDDFASQDEPNIHALTDQYNLDLKRIIADNYPGVVTAQDMFEFVRNGMGVPYVPGSSIKGALRTVLFWKMRQSPQAQQDYAELLENVLQARSERGADNAFIEKAFNIAVQRKRPHDANRDLMRVLHVGDVHFNKDNLTLADTRIFNLSSAERFGWKNIAARRNETDPRQATQLAAEALRIGATVQVTLTIDDFLLQSPVAQKEAAFDKYASLFQALPQICNDYAARQIAKQHAFFEKYNLTALVSFYDELEKERANLPEGDFLLRLSWGSGWQGMTGELVENSDGLQQIRKKFNMGKFEMQGEMPDECPICHSKKIRPDNRKEGSGFCFEGKHSFPVKDIRKVLFPIFPKTRKVALHGNQPRYPFGWVVFRQTPPELPPAEDRSKLAPPAYRPMQRSGGGLTQPPLPPPPPIPKPPKVPKEVAIHTGEKLRAELFKIDGGKYHVRLLEKDTGRELAFSGAFLPVSVGDLLEVRVKATNPAGNQITKIEFVSKVKK